jgi:hypothetical protein
MACFVHFENSLDPGDDLVGAWVGRLVEVDDTVLLEGLDRSIERGVSAWQWREVIGLDVQLIVVFEK